MRAAALILVATVAAFGTACQGSGACRRPDAGMDAARASPGKLDLLFMLANGGGSWGQRSALAQHLPDLLEQLDHTALPLDLHVGMVTSNLGAPLEGGVWGCDPPGDQGVMQSSPMNSTCETAHLDHSSDHFLWYALGADGGPPRTNFSGDLAAAFSCYVGTNESCRFEHQLGSVQAALDGCNSAAGCTQAANAGFLRADAILAVIMLGNYDDCSAPADTTLFDPSQTAVDSPLGPPTTYRCFEFGASCDGVSPGRTAGPRSGCIPGAPDPDLGHQLVPVEEYAAFLKGLKSDPRMVYVGVIAAPPTPVVVDTDANGSPTLRSFRCGGQGAMMPGIRLAAFAGLFDPDRGRFFSCADEFGATMQAMGTDLAAILDR